MNAGLTPPQGESAAVVVDVALDLAFAAEALLVADEATIGRAKRVLLRTLFAFHEARGGRPPEPVVASKPKPPPATPHMY